jgi:prepilin-type N-terminal cleavage/methylation domain-containing protein/prepilin-type processing-associated H-X9-DG protein
MDAHRCYSRRAFTLIEVIVVIAIIALTIALLVVAIQKVRETANLVTCQNNLRQLAFAAHGYQATNARLPPNYHEDASRTDGSHNLFYGPVVRLLPYLELNNSYTNFSFLYYDSTFPQGTMGITWPRPDMNWQRHNWWRNPFNRPPAMTTGFVPPANPLTCPNPTGSTNVPGQTWGAEGYFRVFACPSHPFDHSDPNQGTVILTFLQGIPTIDMPRGNPYSYNGSPFPTCSDANADPAGQGCTQPIASSMPGAHVVGRSDYVAVLGAFIDGSFPNDPPLDESFARKYQSLFNYNVDASLARVPDGTSNTLLFGEFCGVYQTIPQANIPALNGWSNATWATSGLSVAFGTCPDPSNNIHVPGGRGCDFSGYGGGLGSGIAFGGWHEGRFNVAFADGSVHALRLGLDQMLLFSLAGYHDGDPVTGSDF